MNDIVSPSTTLDAINRSLDTPALDPVLLAIANDYLAGNDVTSIAEDYGITEDRVTSIIEKREVKAYVDGVFATQGYLNRNKRMTLINQVIEMKIAEGLETGVMTKKDLLDWLKHLADIETAVKGKQNGPQVAIQVNNYDKLMKDIME